jgi:signal peptidase I
VVRVLLVALSALVAPGFAHALMRQRKPMWIAFGAMAVSILLWAFTAYGLLLSILIALATMVDAGLRYRRLRPKIRWSWLDPLIVFFANIVMQFATSALVVEAFKAPSTSMNPTLQIGDHFFINKLTRSPDRGDIITFRQPCEPERDYVKRVIALGGDKLEIRCNVVYINGTAVSRELVDRNATYEDLDMAGWGREAAWRTIDSSRYREILDGRSFEIFHDRELPARDDARKAGTAPVGDVKDFPQDSTPRSCFDGTRTTDQSPGTVTVTAEPGDPCKPHMHYVVPDDHVFVMGDNRANSNDSRYWGSVPISHIKGKVTGIWYPFAHVGGVN